MSQFVHRIPRAMKRCTCKSAIWFSKINMSDRVLHRFLASSNNTILLQLWARTSVISITLEVLSTFRICPFKIITMYCLLLVPLHLLLHPTLIKANGNKNKIKAKAILQTTIIFNLWTKSSRIPKEEVTTNKSISTLIFKQFSMV